MKRGRGLSAGEDALWRRAMRDVRPLRGPSPQRPAGLPLGETTREAMTPVFSRPLPPRPARRESVFVAGDPGFERRLKRGRLGVEATLDLHGLNEAAARARFEGFVRDSSARGRRCVLVITGKGRLTDNVLARPRGVIRRAFFDWVEEEPLRALIARAAPARPRDGGAGAFYLFLKGLPARR
ncbi:MAG: Smr/MutS family protein [Amphiplicatus sp.]